MPFGWHGRRRKNYILRAAAQADHDSPPWLVSLPLSATSFSGELGRQAGPLKLPPSGRTTPKLLTAGEIKESMFKDPKYYFQDIPQRSRTRSFTRWCPRCRSRPGKRIDHWVNCHNVASTIQEWLRASRAIPLQPPPRQGISAPESGAIHPLFARLPIPSRPGDVTPITASRAAGRLALHWTEAARRTQRSSRTGLPSE